MQWRIEVDERDRRFVGSEQREAAVLRVTVDLPNDRADVLPAIDDRKHHPAAGDDGADERRAERDEVGLPPLLTREPPSSRERDEHHDNSREQDRQRSPQRAFRHLQKRSGREQHDGDHGDEPVRRAQHGPLEAIGNRLPLREPEPDEHRGGRQRRRRIDAAPSACKGERHQRHRPRAHREAPESRAVGLADREPRSASCGKEQKRPRREVEHALDEILAGPVAMGLRVARRVRRIQRDDASGHVVPEQNRETVRATLCAGDGQRPRENDRERNQERRPQLPAQQFPPRALEHDETGGRRDGHEPGGRALCEKGPGESDVHQRVPGQLPQAARRLKAAIEPEQRAGDAGHHGGVGREPGGDLQRQQKCA